MCGTSVKTSLARIVLFIIGLPIGLAVSGEALLRAYIHFRYGIPGKSYGIYMADKELGAIHRPHSYNSNSVINNWGFRNAQDILEQKPLGSTRIYCSGGSTTFCYNLTTEESWPSILQHKLRQRPGHERDEVPNAGEITFAISHELALARRLVPRLKPDVVILLTGMNESLAAQILERAEKTDLNRLLREKRWGVFPRHLDQARFLKRNSVVVRFIDYVLLPLFEKRRTDVYRQPDPPKWFHLHPWIMTNFEHTLRAYLAFLQDHGCRVIIIRYGDNGIETWYLRDVLRKFRDRAVEIGREEGALICDIASIVERHPRRLSLYIDSGVHVTKEGAELMADELLKTLDQLGIDRKT